ncbi:hypothetical protein K9M74_00425 [Candidatus Woesearchaeota archaeon]|nr:hypothetical protein [Candidatus Woesearchaeota archaeon]
MDSAIQDMNTFIHKFTQLEIPLNGAISIHKAVYMPHSSAQPLLEKTPEEPVATGLFLGTRNKHHFTPSINLLRLITPHTSQKIVLNEKAAWLFVCGRDAFPNNVLSGDMDAKQVIVQNEEGEVLGMAKKTPEFYKNIVHAGQLLKNK